MSLYPFCAKQEPACSCVARGVRNLDRFRVEANFNSWAEFDGSVENDPERTSSVW